MCWRSDTYSPITDSFAEAVVGLEGNPAWRPHSQSRGEEWNPSLVVYLPGLPEDRETVVRHPIVEYHERLRLLIPKRLSSIEQGPIPQRHLARTQSVLRTLEEWGVF